MRKGVKYASVIVVVVVVIILFSFLVPVIGYSSSDTGPFGVQQVQHSATVSVTFDLFHCGYVLNPTATTTTLGHETGQSIAPTGFYCSINTAPSPQPENQ